MKTHLLAAAATALLLSTGTFAASNTTGTTNTTGYAAAPATAGASAGVSGKAQTSTATSGWTAPSAKPAAGSSAYPSDAATSTASTTMTSTVSRHRACTLLEAQFDASIAAKSAMADAAHARTLRAQATPLCKTDPRQGVQTLHDALGLIGVKPTA